MELTDGTGGGYSAKVTSDNRVSVSSRAKSHIAYTSKEKGAAFSVYGARTFIAGSDTDEGLLYFKYTGVKNFHVERIVCTGNGTSNKIELWVAPTYTSGGTAVTPINLNRSSNNVLSCIALNGISTLVVTPNTNEVVDIRFGVATSEFILDGTLILGINDSLYLSGSVGTAGNKLRVAMFGYEE